MRAPQESITDSSWPKDSHAKALFDSDRTCCICRDLAKKHYLQVHHIDSNRNNDDPENLAVLCLECHADTLAKGGFTRKLSPKEVKLFRDDWLAIVREEKRSKPPKEEDHDLLVPDIKTDFVKRFLQQFHDEHVLPADVSFDFGDYFFMKPATFSFLAIPVTSDAFSDDSGPRLTSILKAYLLCILGEITPPWLLVTETLDPTSRSLWSILVDEDTKISVPQWYVTGFRHLGFLHVYGLYFEGCPELLLRVHPMLIDTKQDYASLTLELQGIGQALSGKRLTL